MNRVCCKRIEAAISFAGVQKHVAIRERAGLVTKQRQGRRLVVGIRVEGLREAEKLLDEYEMLWRGRFERIADLIAADQEADR